MLRDERSGAEKRRKVKKWQSILHLTKNLLLYEWNDKRVIIGFLTGMTVPFSG